MGVFMYKKMTFTFVLICALFLSACIGHIKNDKNFYKSLETPIYTGRSQKTEPPKTIELESFPCNEPDDEIVEKMWEKPGVYYTGAEIDSINNSLGIDFKKELNSVCDFISEESSKSVHILVNIQQPLKINFSRGENSAEDYAIIVSISGNAEWPRNMEFLFAYVKDKSKYVLKLVKDSAKFGFTGGFIDIDFDGKKEFVIDMPDMSLF